MDLLRAEEVVCRAWDEAMNTQPDSFTWNLMGMLNNCHYRVKVGPHRLIGHSMYLHARFTCTKSLRVLSSSCRSKTCVVGPERSHVCFESS